MGYLFVSENYENNNNILYIRENLSSVIFKEIENKVTADKYRVGISFFVEDKILLLANEEIADKIADVIAIAYKYDYFNEKVKVGGLNVFQKDLLITSLISADLTEDKRYIRSKIGEIKDFAIDGFFNFRLTNLKKKWEEICNYIPEFFSGRELKDFMMYLINEKKGKKIFIDGNKVYDKLGNRLKKSSLIPISKFSVFKEILLSASSSMEMKRLPSDEIELKYIKEYFGDKILFKSSEIL